MTPETARTLLFETFAHAVAAARPEAALRSHLPVPAQGPVHVLAAGKAAIPMARIAARVYPSARGLIVCHTPCPDPPDRFAALRAGHPVPDAESLRAGQAALALVRDLGADDTMLVLLSGGASALLCAPLPGLSLADKQAMTRALLASGLDIGAMNTVRRHLSALKGGRLAAAAWPVRCLTYAVSDVVGDVEHDIASGPTVGDPTTRDDARAVLARLGGAVPPAVSAIVDRPEAESVKPEDPRLDRASYEVIVSAPLMLEAATHHLERQGVHVVSWGVDITGDAAEVATAHAARLPPTVSRPTAFLSGGEVTVRLGPTAGAGGPNQHYALALALVLNGRPDVWAIAADTDGRDGMPVAGRDQAGACVGPDTIARAEALGLSLHGALVASDSGTVFRALGDAIVTGPTGTNVNDVRCILMLPTG